MGSLAQSRAARHECGTPPRTSPTSCRRAYEGGAQLTRQKIEGYHLLLSVLLQFMI